MGQAKTSLILSSGLNIFENPKSVVWCIKLQSASSATFFGSRKKMITKKHKRLHIETVRNKAPSRKTRDINDLIILTLGFWSWSNSATDGLPSRLHHSEGICKYETMINEKKNNKIYDLYYRHGKECTADDI